MKKILIILLVLTTTDVLCQQTYFNKNYDWNGQLESFVAISNIVDDFWVVGISSRTLIEKELLIGQFDKYGNNQWAKSYFKPNHQFLSGDLLITGNNHLVFASLTNNETENTDYFLAKIDLWGDTLWTKTYNSGKILDGSRKVIQTVDGGYMMTGFSENYPEALGQAYLVKTDAFGNLEWQQEYGVADSSEVAQNIIQTEDKGYMVLADKSDGHGKQDAWIFKIDSLGNYQWGHIFGFPYYDEPRDFVEVEDGYVVVGLTHPPGPPAITYSDHYIFKIDKNGKLLWEKVYGGPSTGEIDISDSLRGIEVLEDGSLIAIGISRNFNEESYRSAGVIMKLTAEGDSIWTKAYYNNNNNHYFWDFEVLEDESFAICGWGYGIESGTQDGWILKVDSLGNTCQPANCDSIFTTSIHYDITTRYPTRFYPNPAKNQVTFEHRLPKDAVLEVYDLKGALVREEQIAGHGSTLELDIEAWESGLYLYRVRMEGKEVSSGKILCR